VSAAIDCTLAAATSHVGVNESPPNSNCQPFSTALHRPCEAWCADFLCYCDHVDCGLDFAWLGLGPTGSAGCAVITGAAKRVGRFGIVPKYGCWVMFGAGGGSHTERVKWLILNGGTLARECPPGRTVIGIVSIGGNTSAPSNYNGGTVAEHARYFGSGDDIYGFVYPPYTDAPAPAINMEELVEPIVFVRNDIPAGQPKTAWLVMVTGEGPCGLRRIAMGDAADLRNRPDGYGPPVEVDKDQLGGIPLTTGPAPANV
jgi:hypothetical protein